MRHNTINIIILALFTCAFFSTTSAQTLYRTSDSHLHTATTVGSHQYAGTLSSPQSISATTDAQVFSPMSSGSKYSAQVSGIGATTPAYSASLATTPLLLRDPGAGGLPPTYDDDDEDDDKENQQFGSIGDGLWVLLLLALSYCICLTYRRRKTVVRDSQLRSLV